MPTQDVRVLLVDDNCDAIEALAMLFGSEGYSVRTAHDGMSALKEAEAWLPDVIFLDIGLPGMSGHEVAKAIRQANFAGDKPLLVALSGYGGERDRQLSLEAGFDHHVLKPAQPDQLFELLDSSVPTAGRPERHA